MGRGVGARSEDKLLLATLNFGNVQGDEWVIQTRYLRYIQAFWGWIGGNIFSWQLCRILYVALENSKTFSH